MILKKRPSRRKHRLRQTLKLRLKKERMMRRMARLSTLMVVELEIKVVHGENHLVLTVVTILRKKD